jgi:hypothetical protein
VSLGFALILPRAIKPADHSFIQWVTSPPQTSEEIQRNLVFAVGGLCRDKSIRLCEFGRLSSLLDTHCPFQARAFLLSSHGDEQGLRRSLSFDRPPIEAQPKSRSHHWLHETTQPPVSIE